MQFSDGVLEFIISVRNVTYKIIGFVFVEARFYFLNICKNKFDWRLQGCFCFDSLIKNHKLTKL